VPVAHACNPWEEHSSRPAQAWFARLNKPMARHDSSHLSYQGIWEVEIRRSEVSGQTRQKRKIVRPYLNGKHAGHGGTCLSYQTSNGGKHKIGDHGPEQKGLTV
jgi:hypothetical protein